VNDVFVVLQIFYVLGHSTLKIWVFYSLAYCVRVIIIWILALLYTSFDCVVELWLKKTCRLDVWPSKLIQTLGVTLLRESLYTPLLLFVTS